MSDAAAGPERLPVIDALRALALSGVILMNLIGMVMVYAPGQVIQSAGPADYAMSAADLIFVQGKARSTFAFLFGVGFGLLMSRTGAGFHAYYLRRMSALLLIGLINMAFLFWGDILILYAVMGMVLSLFRGWSDRAILTLGLVLIAVPPVVAGAIEIVTGGPLAGLSGVLPADGWAKVEARAPIYAGGDYPAMVRANVAYYVEKHLFDTVHVAVYSLGVLGLFLTGLWTARKGVFANVEAHRAFLRKVALVCLPIGLPLSVVQALPTAGMTFEGPVNGLVAMTYVGLPMTAFGYVAVLTLWLSKGGGWLRSSLTPMGRMALTGYLGSNLIGSFIWYGWGLGLMGKVNFVAMNLLSLAVFAGLAVFSAIWVKMFRQGPVEGLWRRLSGPRTRAA
jgi:uncharacterized protein